MKPTSHPFLVVGTVEGIELLGAELPGVAGRSPIEGRRITALARGPQGWWAIVDGREIWASPDAAEWGPRATVEKLSAHCLLPMADGVLIGGSAASLLRLADGVVSRVESFDSVEGRDDWYTPWGGAPDTRWLCRAGSGAFFVNVHVGGILKSSDQGRTWIPTIDMDADVHQVLAHPHHADHVIAATGVGLAWSLDGGATWRLETEGLHARYQRAIAIAGGTVLVSASKSERGEQSAVYRRPINGTRPLERCREGLPQWFTGNINTGCLVAHGTTAVIGDPGGSIYVSRDEGATWSLEHRARARVTCLALGQVAPAPTD